MSRAQSLGGTAPRGCAKQGLYLGGEEVEGESGHSGPGLTLG